jgi:hypothetical protein
MGYSAFIRILPEEKDRLRKVFAGWKHDLVPRLIWRTDETAYHDDGLPGDCFGVTYGGSRPGVFDYNHAVVSWVARKLKYKGYCYDGGDVVGAEPPWWTFPRAKWSAYHKQIYPDMEMLDIVGGVNRMLEDLEQRWSRLPKPKRGPSPYQRHVLLELSKVNAAPTSALLPPGCERSVGFQVLEMLEAKGLMIRRRATVNNERLWSKR